MTSLPPLLALALVVSMGACNGDPLPAPHSPAPAVPARQTESSPADRAVPLVVARPAAQPAQEPPDLDPAGVLDDEERRLLDADDATLTRDERVARAHAQRKLVMADPEHPLRPRLDKLEQDVASGEYAQMARDMYSGRTAFPDHSED